MTPLQSSLKSSLKRAGVVSLVVLTLGWAVGLLVFGMWRSRDKTQAQSAQTSDLPQTFAQVQQVPTGVFTYGGSPAWATIRLVVDSAIQAERREFQLQFQPQPAPSDSKIQRLLAGQIDIAQSARPLTETESQLAQQQGVVLKQIPVAIDGIAIAVHPTLPISGLTLEQLRGIFRGRIRNWQQLGGPNLAITPYSLFPDRQSTVEFFTESVLENQAFGDNVVFVETTTQALRQLKDTPGSIYYASVAKIIHQCTVKPLSVGPSSRWVPPYQPPLVDPAQCPAQRNQLNSQALQSGAYPLTRKLYVVIKQNGQLEEHGGQAYANFLLTEQGQSLILKAGFSPLQ